MEQIAANPGARGTASPSPDTRPVGIVGFGLLGEAFAQRLRAAGLQVLACDPAPERRARMAALGVAEAAGAGAVATAAGCVLLAVYDAAQAGAALRALAAAAPTGEPLAVLCATTLAPEDAQALARAQAAGPLRFIEMPVSGSSRQVEEGAALALLGTDAPLPPRARQVADAVCPRQLRLAGGGAAARMKLVVNLVLEINRAALAEGLTLARAFGLDLALAEEALRGSAAASRVMEHQAAKMRLGDFRPVARLAQSLKDMDAMLAGGRARFLPLGAATRALLACCAKAGEGALDSAAVVRELQRRAAQAPEALPC